MSRIKPKTNKRKKKKKERKSNSSYKLLTYNPLTLLHTNQSTSLPETMWSSGLCLSLFTLNEAGTIAPLAFGFDRGQRW